MTGSRNKSNARNVKLHLLLDTCVWLDLAKQPDGAKVVHMLREFIEKEKIELLVPKIVRDEFIRNRSRVEAMMTRSVTSRLREVRQVVDEHGHDDTKGSIIHELDDLAHQLPIVKGLATQTFDSIAALLESAEAIDVTSELNELTIKRALSKRAPFHREKNSVADALIIEIYGQACSNATSIDQYCFVTLNTKDFSDVTGDDRLPHEDFKEYFTKPNSHYSINLQSILSAHFAEEIAELDLDFDYHEEPRALSEVLPFLSKLSDQIWYNRHKNRERQIEEGRITLVDKSDGEYHHDTILKEIWDGALLAAKQVEDLYGLEQLGPWDDFEWGMLSGQMSAIRWMLGEDWESTLDI